MADQTGAKKVHCTVMVYIQADDTLANFAVQSLRELKRAASDQVTAAAQFKANEQTDIYRYVFSGKDPDTGELRSSFNHSGLDPRLVQWKKAESILAEEFISINRTDSIAAGTNMADPETLSDFINWAYEKCPAEHYSLIFWGHGPELLLNEYVAPGALRKQKSFLTPTHLGKALAHNKLIKHGEKFEVIGIDACCMSMLEVAYEIRKYADVLIASQEEVPDFSFPYPIILTAISKEMQKEAEPLSPKEAESLSLKEVELLNFKKLCEQIPKLYAYVYQEYFLDKQASMQGITLTSIFLDNLDPIVDLANQLAETLLRMSYDEAVRHGIIEARAACKGFVAGLFADLYDFCEQLMRKLLERNFEKTPLMETCEKILEAIKSRDSQACIIENQALRDQRCHGLSIYFPYLTEPEKAIMEAPFAPTVKGGIDALNKDVLSILNKGGMDALNKIRRQRIAETEAYYDDLLLSQKTRWGEFIRQHWSVWMVEDLEARIKLCPKQDLSESLDERYSAQQCALNLLSLLQDRKTQGDMSVEHRPGKKNNFGDLEIATASLVIVGNSTGT